MGTVVSNANLFQKVVSINGKNVSKVFEAKDVENLIIKIKNQSHNSEETIVIKKSVINKLLKISSELEEIKRELNFSSKTF